MPHLSVILTDGENNYACVNVPLSEFKRASQEEVLAYIFQCAESRLREQRGEQLKRKINERFSSAAGRSIFRSLF
jgi:hypothetical protein